MRGKSKAVVPGVRGCETNGDTQYPQQLTFLHTYFDRKSAFYCDPSYLKVIFLYRGEIPTYRSVFVKGKTEQIPIFNYSAFRPTLFIGEDSSSLGIFFVEVYLRKLWPQKRYERNFAAVDLPEQLRRALELGGFQKHDEFVNHEYFGNEVVTYGSSTINLRLVKHRGQWHLELGPADNGEWYQPEDVVTVASTAQLKPGPTDLDSWAGALGTNLEKIRALFANYRGRQPLP